MKLNRLRRLAPPFGGTGDAPTPTPRRYHLVPAAAVVRISTARPTLAPHEAKIRPPRSGP